MDYKKLNKIIAEFDGNWIETIPEKFPENRYWKNKKLNISIGNLAFHRSWCDLMPIVEKIEQLDLTKEFYQWEYNGKTYNNFESISVDMNDHTCYIWLNHTLDPPNCLSENSIKTIYKSKLDAVYSAVIEFIEWYNQLNKK